MVAERFQGGFISRNINQHQIINIIPNQNGIIGFGMVVVAVEGHVDAFDHFAVLIRQADKGHEIMELFDSHIRGDSLGAIGGDRAIMTGAAVVEEDISIPSPEFVTDRIIFSLAETRLSLP